MLSIIGIAPSLPPRRINRSRKYGCPSRRGGACHVPTTTLVHMQATAHTRSPLMLVWTQFLLLVLCIATTTPVDALVAFPLVTSFIPFRPAPSFRGKPRMPRKMTTLYQSTPPTTTSSTVFKATEKTPYRLSLTPYIDPSRKRRNHPKLTQPQGPPQLWNTTWFPPQKSSHHYDPKVKATAASTALTTTPSKPATIMEGKHNSEPSTETKTITSSPSTQVIPSFSWLPTRTQSSILNNDYKNSLSSSLNKATSNMSQQKSLFNNDSKDAGSNSTTANAIISNTLPTSSTTTTPRNKSSASSPTPAFMMYPATIAPTNTPSMNRTKKSMGSTKNTTTWKNYTLPISTTGPKKVAAATPYMISNSFLDSITSSLQTTTNELLRSTTANMAGPTWPGTISTPIQRSLFTNPNKNSTAAILPSPLAHLKPNDTLTVADLEQVLHGFLVQQQQQQQAYMETLVRSTTSNSNNPGSSSSLVFQNQNNKPSSNVDSSSSIVKTNMNNKSSGGVVAFPQPSLLRYKDLQKGTTVSGSIAGLLVGMTILPNLWLIGMILGGTYGYGLHPEDHTDNDDATTATKRNNNPIRRLILCSGRKLAKWYLQLYDYCHTIWFLYKTGQLSYEYYQRYAELDDKFGIQAKMDAWNAVRNVRGGNVYQKQRCLV
jgi:hypothetical protein